MQTEVVENILHEIKGLPVPVKQWKIETGPDHTGDDAVWVWAVLGNRKADWQWKHIRRINDLVSHAVRAGADGTPPLVYVSFQKLSEQAYLRELQERDDT